MLDTGGEPPAPSREALARALAESEAKFRTLADHAPVGIIIRKAGVNDYANPMAAEIFEATTEEVLRPGFIETLVEPAELEKVQSRTRRIRSGALDATSFFVGIRLRAGGAKQLELFISRLEIPDGTTALLTFVDRTEQQRLEEQLLEKNRALEGLAASLEQRVLEESARRANRDALLLGQSKMAAMGEMLAAIAHQWRQPLSTLGMVLHDLEAELRAGRLDAAQAAGAAARSRQQITFLSQTLEAFLAFYRPDRGLAGFDLVRTVHDAASLLKAQLDYHFIELRVETECGGSGLWIDGSSNHLKQALVNLVQNAKDAVIARRRADRDAVCRVDVRLWRDGDEAVLEVEDSGGGIPDDVRPHLFEPYFSTKPDGTGIGLSMARTIVAARLGGRLDAADGDLGACFTLRLPLSA